jgi:hypothetical protein
MTDDMPSSQTKKMLRKLPKIFESDDDETQILSNEKIQRY